ncbi:SUR7/PalI family protein [Aspergillus clavatus NRRL 1]|uniref:Cortical patch protein SUR7, putative n=1 Tax=Aspergillus clavatus (strain ATCC 1007 / CBS 513.65 / DSM 816 / NCTC 3887 / NRRL 1 / QM 1276 / 107) TaxID=344612 RepID=A1CFA3_ASPCL|nr:cortical patch protein SUR7, putative [Aspergillus clavatus NRRL 1]EAW11552.1 cortical patch protein SUR7, putative [Aspergillus clavatus NRRL 1]
MTISRAGLGLLGLFFTASALLLMFLAFLGGARNSNPLNRIYWLQADTSNIPGAPALSRWTYWNLCAVNDKGHNACGKSYADYPFDPPSHRNFGTTTNIPSAFIGTNHYFLTSRFMFPFHIIALFFATCSLFTGFLAMCTRIGSFVSALSAYIALTFQVITTCLMTAVYVQGRNKFNANGQTSRLGVKAFAFMWTSTALLFLAGVIYCMGGAVGRKESGYSGREQRRRGFFSSHRSGSLRSNKETAA